MSVQDVPNPIIHKISMNPGNETRKVKTRIDEIFEEREERAARRYSVAEMEKMALEAENEASRLRGEPPVHKYGGNGMDEDKKKEEAEKRQLLMGQAKALIEQGMNPEQVGRLLLALPGTSGVPAATQVTQGMTLSDVKDIMEMVTGNRETSELRSMIASLGKQVDELVKGGRANGKPAQPIDPVTFAIQQADAVTAWSKALQEITPKSVQPAATGEPLEIVKEKNRHNEKMEEIKTDKDYKERITDIAAEIPERIGHGIGGQFVERGEDVGDSGGGLESITCGEDGCGTTIYITPETGPQVICPKCKAIYQRGNTVQGEAK